MRAHMSSIVERLQTSPHPRPLILHQIVLRGFVAGISHIHRVVGFSIDPLLDFHGAGAIVEFVGDVCGLCADVADLADKGQLLDFDIVDLEVGVGVRLGGVEDLFYGAGAEGFAADAALARRVQ